MAKISKGGKYSTTGKNEEMDLACQFDISPNKSAAKWLVIISKLITVTDLIIRLVEHIIQLSGKN